MQLRMVTGELAHLKGLAEVRVSIGGWLVQHRACIVAVQDPCNLGFDFLEATGCQLDFGSDTVKFCNGPPIQMTWSSLPAGPLGAPSTPAVSTLEAVNRPIPPEFPAPKPTTHLIPPVIMPSNCQLFQPLPNRQ